MFSKKSSNQLLLVVALVFYSYNPLCQNASEAQTVNFSNFKPRNGISYCSNNVPVGRSVFVKHTTAAVDGPLRFQAIIVIFKWDPNKVTQEGDVYTVGGYDVVETIHGSSDLMGLNDETTLYVPNLNGWELVKSYSPGQFKADFIVAARKPNSDGTGGATVRAWKTPHMFFTHSCTSGGGGEDDPPTEDPGGIN